jgi:hypothetical protein
MSKTLNVEPQLLTGSYANLLNCDVTSMSGPVGLTIGQPYLTITHVRVTNNSNVGVPVYMFKGGSGASVAGTEWPWAGKIVPANDAIDWFGTARLDAADFVVGKAGTASVLTVTFEGTIDISG